MDDALFSPSYRATVLGRGGGGAVAAAAGAEPRGRGEAVRGRPAPDAAEHTAEAAAGADGRRPQPVHRDVRVNLIEISNIIFFFFKIKKRFYPLIASHNNQGLRLFWPPLIPSGFKKCQSLLALQLPPPE